MNRDIEEIFNSIKHNEGRLPKEELQELINREEESSSFLIDYMKDFKKDYKIALEDMSYFGHIYAVYLLAQFKNKEFYNIYLDILELPNNVAMDLYDDGIKEHGGKIIASVYNQDDTRLIEIIQSDNVSKEIKCAVKDAFEIIESDKPKYINSIFDEVANWECFKEEISLEDLIATELKKGIENLDINNSFETQVKEQVRELAKVKEKAKDTEKIKVGRNDLCSCGSAKKYKKCCGK